MKACLLALTVSALITASSSAVIIETTTDNTSVPTGIYTNSGWQFEGQFDGFLGTPIAPAYFLTAKHIGGSIGDAFIYNGVTYHTTALFTDPSADLNLWKVDGAFSTYAPIYTGSSEVGDSLVVIGRGTDRGATVTTNGATNGWLWGASNGIQRWGTNVVSGFTDGGAGFGDLLYADFTNGGTAFEAALSPGDSSGAVFINTGSAWMLAGINYAVDDNIYSASPTGSNPFGSASIYNPTGLFEKNGSQWIPATSSTFYATRVSANTAWIDSVTIVPEPSGTLLALLGGAAFCGFSRQRRPERFADRQIPSAFFPSE